MKHLFDAFNKFLRRSKKTVLLILVVAVITIILGAIISVLLERFDNLHVPSIGTIRTIGVEAYGGEIKLQDGTQCIDWGTIYPGTLTNRSFYLRSISNVKAALHLNATKWNPSDISAYMNLSWNYNGTPIDPGEEIQVVLTLSTSSSNSFIDYLIANNLKEFSFDIIIRATEE